MTNTPTSIQGVAQLASQVHGGAAGRALERLADSHGLVISRTTFDRMRRGECRGTPDASTVEALALAPTIREILAMPEPLRPLRPLAEDLPPDAGTLSPEQRAAVLAVVRQFAKANRALAQHERQENADVSQERQTQAPPMNQAGGSPATDDNVVDLPTAAHPRKGSQSAGRAARHEQDEQGEL